MATKAKFDIPFKKITFDDMFDYIAENYPKDKEWFESICKSGTKYNHLKTVRTFCEKYNPSLIPVAKAPKVNKLDRFKEWH